MTDQGAYLGDGVYAFHDGFHVVVLKTQRDRGWEAIALDDRTFMNLLTFVEKSRGITIKIEPIEETP